MFQYVIFVVEKLFVFSLALYSCDSNNTNDIVCRASSGQIVNWFCDTLCNRSVCFCFTKTLSKFVLDALTNDKTGAIKSLKEVEAIGHRIVHGGEKFASSAVIKDEMIATVEECNDLAPLHNPANLIGIRVCSELMPGVPQVGVFDTAFHQKCLQKHICTDFRSNTTKTTK